VRRFDHFVLPPPANFGLASRLDPRWKLVTATVVVGAALLLHSLALSLVASFACIAVAAAARVPGRWFAARLGTALAAVSLFVLPLPLLVDGPGPSWQLGPLRLSAHGAEVGLLIAARALTIVTVTLTLFATTPTDALLKAAHALGIPSLLIQIGLMTYRYVFVLADELHRLRIAVRVRGFRNRASRHGYRTVGQVAGTLLVRGHERAERVHQAMICRGFDGRFRALTTFHTRVIDVAVFLVVAGGAAGLAVVDRIAF
jgi:cobalt/nickel transport system permease protein